MPRFGRVVLGGTFDRFHAGHEALLRTAFVLGRTVAIGLTSERFLADHPKPRGQAIAPQATRRRSLARWLRQNYPGARWSIVPIDDPFGGSVGDGVDALVVSADTLRGGRAVNRERVRRGRRPVPLFVVPVVLADDLEPLSSRRIRAGEVDRHGHRRSRIAIGLALADAVDRRPVERGILRAFPSARLAASSLRVPSRPSRSALSALAERAKGPRPLGIVVGPQGRGGWPVAVHGLRARLDPRRVPGRSPRDLEQGLARLLRPARG